MPNPRNRAAVLYRASLIRQFGGKCEVPGCGQILSLEFAHVAPTPVLNPHSWQENHAGRGRKERQTDIRKYPWAYALLCREPHHLQLTALERKFKALAGSRERALAVLALDEARLAKMVTWVI